MKLTKNWKLYYVKDSDYQDRKDAFDVHECPSFDNVKIPTVFEKVLAENRVLGDCYKSTNTWDYQTYEDVHQFYVTTFRSRGKKKYLTFHGIDTLSEIYVNGKLIGKTDNVYLPYTFRLTDLKAENELVVHVLPAVVEGRKYDTSYCKNAPKYNYEALFLRKVPSSFGWDILPRTPLGGIYKEVELTSSVSRFADFSILPVSVDKEKAVLDFTVNLVRSFRGTIRIHGECEDSVFGSVSEMHGKSYRNTYEISSPKLWTIRGYGKQNLYDVTIELIRNGKVVETHSMHYGIRKVELFRSSLVEEGGKFEFHINGQKVFLLGSNYVPIEALMHTDDKRSAKAAELLTDIGCNSIRIWGGGTYESDAFYDLCDRLGIFIWQDFMMGCAIYPQTKDFQDRLRTEVLYEVKRLRNHPSIGLWAGDNENDICALFWAKGISPDTNVLTRKVIPNVLKKEDPCRPYIPSSPYIDKKAEKNPTAQLSEDHLWGPRDYFKGNYYTSAYPYFTSESGYHALNSPKSLRKFINHPWPLFVDNSDGHIKTEGYKLVPNEEYLAHAVSVKKDYQSPYAYRIELLYKQVITLFGKAAKNLKDLSLQSQISQAEAMKFFIEKMRKDRNRNGGIIWWNIIDGWPQISDAVVDYYFIRKVAYSYMKRSQSPELVMMEERGEDIDVYALNETDAAKTYSYDIFDTYTGEKVLSGSASVPAYSSLLVKTIPNAPEKRFLIIDYEDQDGNTFRNHFHTHIIDIDYRKYVRIAEDYGLLIKEGF